MSTKEKTEIDKKNEASGGEEDENGERDKQTNVENYKHDSQSPTLTSSTATTVDPTTTQEEKSAEETTKSFHFLEVRL